MPGHFYEKLRKQYRDTQSVPFMLDETRKPLLPETKKLKKRFFFRKMSHSAENPRSPLCSRNASLLIKVEWDLDTSKLEKK